MKRRSFIIIGSKLKTHHLCPCCPPLDYSNGADVCNETIPIYYSHQHALDDGWGYTSDPQYSDPDKPASYICPACMTELGLKQVRRSRAAI